MKKIISLILVCTILLSALCFSSFAGGEEEYALPFTDLKEGAWYMEGIEFCYALGIISGMTETTFVPNGTLTRAQFVQLLAMFDDAKLDEYSEADSGFDDVKTSHWFNAPVCWAVEKGYVAGVSDTKFGPNQPITREQLARLLYLYAESYGVDVSPADDLAAFTDASKVSSWALPQVQWAVAAGIISGTSNTTLSPRATATRAQACRMLMTFFEYMVYGVRDTGGVFADIADFVKNNGEYDPSIGLYYNVVSDGNEQYVIEYYEEAEIITFVYAGEPYQYTEGGETYDDYRELANVVMYGNSTSYEFVYYYGDETDNYISSYGKLYDWGYKDEHTEGYGYDIETIDRRILSSVDKLSALIYEIITATGHTMGEFFGKETAAPEIPDDGPVSNAETFITLAEYAVANGKLNDDGRYVYNVWDDGGSYFKEYCLIYEPENSVMYFTYSHTVGADYNESAAIYVKDIVPKYQYEYTYNMGEDYAIYAGLLGTDASFEAEYTDSNIDVGQAEVLEGTAREDLLAFVNAVLSECGLEMSDLFI